jgi:hypothetical protein
MVIIDADANNATKYPRVLNERLPGGLDVF